MTIIDLDSLLSPISTATPCGPDLEYAPEFLELDRFGQVKPEQQVGKTIVPAQEPEWNEVISRAVALFMKTKDLRVALHLTRALLGTDGIAGLAQGLTLLVGLANQYWDKFYPLLDPDDGNDSTFRINLLNGLCDPMFFLDRLRMIPLISSRSFGRLSFRDISIALGEQPPLPGTTPPKPATVDGAFNECPIPDLQATTTAVLSSHKALSALETIVTEKVGVDSAPNFAKLTMLLEAIEKILVTRLTKRGVMMATSLPAFVGDTTTVNAVTTDPKVVSAAGDEVNNSADVIRLLEKICEYYAKNEPSSPVPILLQRSKRLVSASFLDIVQDLAPAAMPQIEVLKGKMSTNDS